MATRFLRYDSDPILRKKCKAVLKVDDKIRQLKVPLTEVQEDLKKLRDIRYWVRKATPGTEESKEPPKKQPIKERSNFSASCS